MGGTVMNENIDLIKILEGCPAGTEFYSPLFGELKLKCIYGNGSNTIEMVCVEMNRRYRFNRAGKYEMIEMRCSDNWGNYYFSDECLLFPSKDQRDWSKFERFWDKKVERFDQKTWKSGDEVLFRLGETTPWRFGLFSHMFSDDFGQEVVSTSDGLYLICIPYNDDTKHLHATTDDCPDYYKWWKEEK